MDAQIAALVGAIRAMGEDPGNRRRMIVTEEDITSLPIFANDTVFAVKVRLLSNPSWLNWGGGGGHARRWRVEGAAGVRMSRSSHAEPQRTAHCTGHA